MSKNDLWRKELFAVSTCRSSVSIVATLLLVLSAAAARADGLLYQMPKDGAWAAYDLDCTAKAGGVERTLTGTLRMASVGQVTVQDQPCRWIEVQLTMWAVVDGVKGKKEQFEASDSRKVARTGEIAAGPRGAAWWQPESGAATEKFADPRNIDNSPLPIILSGPWKNAKPLKKAEIEGRFGKLLCEGTEGTLEFPLPQAGAMKCKLGKPAELRQPVRRGVEPLDT